LNIATLITLGLIAVCFLRRDGALLSLAFVLLSFGSFSVVPGGTTVLAASVAFLLLAVKVFTQPGASHDLARAMSLKTMGLLVAFMVLAVIWALVVPRVSSPNILVYPMAVGIASYPVHLQPTSANINQSIYQIISCGVALSFFAMARIARFADAFLRAAMWGAVAVIATGLADMIGPHVGLAKVLDLFRTANYTFLNGVEVMGVTRVVGLMPEASTFGALAVSFGALLLFCRNAFAPRLKRRAVVLGVACLAFAALSTSSAAMVSLAVTFALLCADLASRLIIERRADKRAAMNEAAILAGLIFVTVLYFVAFDAQRDFIVRIIDSAVFKKSESDSYIERSAWSRQAWEAFLASGGIGVGVGSVRTSNFFINIIASTGIFGTVLFALFLLRVATAAAPSILWPNAQSPFAHLQDAELARGAKLALAVNFTGLFFVGTVPDYGLFVAMLFGTIVGVSYWAHERLRTEIAAGVETSPPLQPAALISG
jgi:hypothetical protein